MVLYRAASCPKSPQWLNCKSSPSQYFNLKHINNKEDAFLKNNIKASNKNIKYPYYQLESVINKNCVGIDDDGIFVSECDSNLLKHQWNVSKDEKICLK